jgi:peptidyl-dipeptidase A
MTHFERAMYQEQGKDLRAFWWDCVERFQKVTRPENRHTPDWAAKIHLPCAPVYYQNYILGEMNASQLAHCLNQALATDSSSHNEAGENGLNVAMVTSPQVGAYLRERLFKLGARYPWEETLRRVTGEGLNVAYFTRDLEALRN